MSNPDGYRKVQSEGRISLPHDFREENDIEKGDKIFYREHSKKDELIIFVD